MDVFFCSNCNAKAIRGQKQCRNCMAGKVYFLTSSEEEYERIIEKEIRISIAANETTVEGIREAAIQLSTTNEILGEEISGYLGLVFGAGNAAWTIETTASRSASALEKAQSQLRQEAALLQADAVIGITFSMDSSGSAINRSQAITLLGTAVKLR